MSNSNRLDIFVRDIGNGTLYVHKGDIYGFTTNLDNVTASNFALQVAHSICGLEVRIVPEKHVSCPNCGNDTAIHRTFNETIVVGTGEMLDDEYECLETVEAYPGYTITCKECDYFDGEPPQF